MRQTHQGIEYDTALVLDRVRHALGLSGHTEPDIKEAFRRAHRWKRGEDPSHRFGFRTIDAEYEAFLGSGRLPDAVLEYYQCLESAA